MASSIRWKRSDYLTLGRAVADFNRKIKKLETEENKIYLPATVEYSDIKQQIMSRNKLNDVLRSLRSFNKFSAEPVVNRSTGLVITKWEAQEVQIKSTRAQKNLIKQGKGIKLLIEGEKTRKGQEIKSASRRLSLKERQELKLQYIEIVENLRDIKNYRESEGLDYQTYKSMISKFGNIDYKMVKATIYRQNFEKALESFKDFEGYDLLKSKLDRINNPLYFYRYINNSNAEFLKDIFLHYKEGEGLVMSNSESSEQMKFNEALEKLGLVKDTKNKLLRRYKNADSPTLNKIDSIETAEDLFDFMNSVIDYKGLNKYLGIE